MKTTTIYFVIMISLFLAFTFSSYGQLTVDAGKDTTYCTDPSTTAIAMGLKVSIENGTEPYSIAWECKVIPYGILSPQAASDILNDTTLLSPTINNGIWMSTDKITFILNVTDHDGKSAKDSIHVGFSNYACVLGYQVIEISKGDSIWFDAGTPSGDILAYHWEPAYGLSNPESSATWCKPEVTTNYYLTSVNKFGCVCSCHVYEIRIIPTNSKVSMLDENLQWNIGMECVDDGPIHPYDIWSTSFLHTESDTIMNEKHYKKLISCADSLCGKKSLKSYIREEAAHIFFANKTEEVLQFDFNLLQGDTMIMDFIRAPDLPYYVRIDSVKSTVWSDNKERITQYVTVFDYYSGTKGYSLNDVFVEGIGSLKFGLEYPTGMFFTGGGGCWPNLLCLHASDNLIYSNPNYNTCYLSTGISEMRQPDLVQVSANNGMLEIHLKNTSNGGFSVFDIQGKRILSQTINNSDSQFCMPRFGVYLYRFESNKGEVQTGRLLVK
jgi:hypothetical protein